MRKIWILGLVGVLALVLAGCGGEDDRFTVVIRSLSDQPVDGDIGFTAPSTFSISQANVTKNVLYGIDSGGTEFRAFLDFPLDGSTGGGVVPLGAVIVSADIEVFVDNVSISPTVPTLLDLVTFPITGLTSGDFNSTPLLTRSPFNILSSDINHSVRIDVTSLMVEAQRRGDSNLQLRFLLDLVPGASGLVQLDDSVAATAPLLTVEFR
ncbi:hypothetical protein [Candidatus Deferrimicrobium sp.]|uniref:hypothetical protein n=1 Tax=Candidatus Deferrimicrobium sp. TaxID=3060586 RepID=UPI002720EC87|nr:hypothetical protein [Candidatus Deferrimicrobium sp.]MDO8739767.1 hypothetical protein [Candidatus Deferrimicrobium sp.]